MNPLELLDSALDGPEAETLIEEIQRFYIERYGGPDDTPVTAAEFAPPDGAFLLAQVGGELVGCAGLRRHDAETVELKRMYVRPGHRRRGLARILLRAVETRAGQLGYQRLILETGYRQPEAIALYASSGYRPVAAFGRHSDEPGSRCFIKDL